MTHLYIYTVRDARIDGKLKYVGLIPKLFDELHDSGKLLKEVFDADALKYTTQMEMFRYFINKKGLRSLLWNSREIHPNDIYKIIYMNFKYLERENYNKKEFFRLCEHLFEGHMNMEYGLYFGCRKANNDKDFLENIKKTEITNANQSIVYYTKLEDMLENIDEIKETYDFKGNLFYFNTCWNYGNIDENSIKYNHNNKKEFVDYIKQYDNEVLELSEMVCHVPLEYEKIFKITYQQLGGSTKKN